jgi:hypothetical protein
MLPSDVRKTLAIMATADHGCAPCVAALFSAFFAAYPSVEMTRELIDEALKDSMADADEVWEYLTDM